MEQDFNEEYSLNATAQTSATLSILREEAITNLLKNGDRSTFNSKGTSISDDELDVVTTEEGTGDQSTLHVSGQEFPSPGLNLNIKGDYNITRTEDGEVSHEKMSFRLKHGFYDDFRDLPHYRVSMTRTTADGTPIESYNPAVTTLKSDGGTLVRDNNGQSVRIAESTDGVNCKPDYSRKNSGKMECEYILEDAELGTLSYNETRTKTAQGFQHRSVIREMGGKVLGIVNQNFSLDDRGMLKEATTTARRPQGFRE